MKVAIASDHRGYHLKEKVMSLLKARGHEVVDDGPSSDTSVDYPDFAKAVADAVVERAAQLGQKPLGVEGYDGGEWVLIDLDDVIVHVFQGEKREHYDLERLWADAPLYAFETGGAGAVQKRRAP